MKQNFIKTSDESTAETLKNLNYQQVDFSNGIYTFLNTDKINFSENIDKSKIQYSNMLCVYPLLSLVEWYFYTYF